MITIHDGNFAEFVQAIAQEPGFSGMLPRESEIGTLAYARPYSEAIDLIPPSEYESRYQSMIGKFARQKKAKYNPALHYQGRHPLCWAYSLAQHCESCRAKMGLPYVTLAPESLLGTTGYRDVGWYLERAIKWLSENGIARRELVPQWTFNPREWDESYKSDALDYVPLEIYDLGTVDMFDECMTALLTGDAIYFGLNWMKHAMNYEEIQKVGNEYCFWTPNTHGEGKDILLKGKSKLPDSAFVVRAMTYAK